MNPGIFTPKELRRYLRHFILPGFGKEAQERLKQSKVLVVGAGGLGCPALQYLAAAGMGQIGIIDNDKVNEDNLQRQVLYGDQDMGKLKSVIARQRLQHQNPMVEYKILNIFLGPGNALDILKDYDLIVDATDNFPTRYLINDACILLNKPWVFGSIYTYEGQLSVFNYHGGPSLRCIYPHQPGPDEAPDPENIGVIGALPGIIGTMMAWEAIKALTGTGQVASGKMLLLNILDYSFRHILIEKNPANFEIISLSGSYT